VHAPRRVTRPIETQRPQKSPAAPITVRPNAPRRPPFVRSNPPPTVAKTPSAAGVVVQRNVVVGATPPADARQRIRPPVPYVVSGGTHPIRHAPLDTPAEQVIDNTEHADQGPPPPSASEPPAARSSGAFGPAGPDDKSLDEVILEYLSEDGD